MTPKQRQRKKQTEEMERLYLKEKKTLQEIGDEFGISRQAVHERLTKAGVKMRNDGGAKPIRLNRSDLLRLYVDEKLTIQKTAESLNLTQSVVARELKRHKIESRLASYYQWKYYFLKSLEVGEQTEFDMKSARNPVQSLHGSARRLQIKISVRRIEQNIFRITRIK